MKKNEKIIIIVLVLLVICVILFAKSKGKNKKTEDNSEKSQISSVNKEEQETGNYVQETEDGTKVNKSKKFAEKKTVKGIEFTNIQFTEINGETSLIATVKNTGSEKTEMLSVDIILLDKNGEVMTILPGLIASLEAGGTSQFSASTTLSYVEAYDFRIEVKEK